jgi:hypothetical protein
MIPQNLTIAELSSTLSSEEFELLVRHRLQAAFRTVAPNTSMIMLLAVTTYGNANELKEATWKIGTSAQTSGEILSECVDEHNRRLNFEKTCTLRLIEASPTITSELVADATA